MAHDTSAKLVKMANQISQFFVGQGDEASAVAGVIDHIKKNWPAAMRAALVRHAHSDGKGLSPLARQAALRLEA
jgi:formate dehydrogenase subunit delta